LYSDVQGGEEAAYVDVDSTLHWLEGNIDVDPIFVGGGDYHLAGGSLCIDAGDPDSSYNDECFPPSMGTERNDMGAYGGPGACEWHECWDSDGDGYEDEACGGDDCDDADPGVSPGAAESCDNGLDDDCDGLTDAADDDCWVCVPDDTQYCDTGLQGVCADGTQTCVDGFWGECVQDVLPGDEICDDGLDNDCDGMEDTDDLDCVDFTLDVIGTYVPGYLSLTFTIGAPEPVTWAVYLVLTEPTVQVMPLWTAPLPIIPSPTMIPVAFPFPSVGWIGIWTGLFTIEGPQAVDLEWIHTG